MSLEKEKTKDLQNKVKEPENTIHTITDPKTKLSRATNYRST